MSFEGLNVVSFGEGGELIGCLGRVWLRWGYAGSGAGGEGRFLVGAYPGWR